MRAFDIRDPLPTGTTLLEASAGTGKTWTIGALVTRYVAEGVVTLEQMLIVTFGRAASQELRERVRTQLVEAERALASPEEVSHPSDLITLLLEGSADLLRERRRRLRDALGAFDGATIATTHQFCHLVLRSLGVAGDTDSSATLVEDLEDLLGEVVDDLYLRRFADSDGAPPLKHADAMALARSVVSDPQARLEPADADPGSGPGLRVAFAHDVRRELERRKRRLGVLSYDDLLSQLADALSDDAAPARQRMRQRWKVVLVDEFQDTDPVQWQVLDRAFTGHATMVLIGDPKQAIYAFRGGDVTTYLQAAATATTRKTLTTNWRSDTALLDSLQAMMRGAALGDEAIVVRDVAAHHEGSRLAGAGPPFRLRVVRKDVLGRSPGSSLTIGTVRPHVYDDVARDIVRLLTSGATFDGEPLQPRDLAVIAFRNNDLQAIQQALADIGVPAVVAGSGSVFATPAATEWLRLLEALEQPHRSARVRSAALTSFFGRTATELDAGGDELTDRIASTARDWAELLATRGVAAVLEAAVTAGLTARVLARVDGERLLTDLRHVGQSLHQVSVDERLGLVALLTWLRGQMAEDKVEVATERTRRLDSDAAAVQLVTIHGSKGLEYPVVYLPTLWDRFPQEPTVPRFHADDHRCIDVGQGGPQWAAHLSAAREEDDGELLRLLYVAMTRARSQVVAWWAPTAKNTPHSSLQRMLFGRQPGWSQVPPQQAVHSEDDVVRILGGVAGRRRPVAGDVGVAAAAHGRPVLRRAAARRAPVHAARRHGLAPHVVLRPVGRRAERPGPQRGRQRAGGASAGRRGAGARRRGARRGTRQRRRHPVADARPAGGGDVRLARARGAGARRPAGAGPARGAARPDPRAARPLAGGGRCRRPRRRPRCDPRQSAGAAGRRADPARDRRERPAARDGLRAAAGRRGRERLRRRSGHPGRPGTSAAHAPATR